MMNFGALSTQTQYLIYTLLFAAILFEFVLILLNRISYSDKLRHNLPACAIIAILFAVFSMCAFYRDYSYDFPVIIVIISLTAAAVHIPIKTVLSINHRKNNLSPYAIKEAMDDLSTGVFFADESCRIILCNRTMGELSSVLIGSYPQTSVEMQAALNNPRKPSGVIRISDNPVLHRFPDGKVWRFCTAVLPEPHGFIQTTAQDVTELHGANERLSLENEEMRKVNASLKKMYERLSDRIREQETLDLKTRIHNNIGASLIAISEIMNNTKDGDMEQQLRLLQDAVGYFSDDRTVCDNTFDELRLKAAEMNVKLVLKVNIPENTANEGLIVAAVRECVTNCINHAKGNRVTVDITEHFDIYTVIITNNGEPPKDNIREGGGLSNLRRSIETAGGEMHISHSPAFALILNLPRKDTAE